MDKPKASKAKKPMTPTDRAARLEIITHHVKEILETLDEDLREGLQGTPERVARMYLDELYQPGNPLDEVLSTIFVEETFAHEMIVLDHIPFCSWCEHHMLPYVGVAHVGYVPRKGVIGLSKIARLVTAAGRGLTIQERVTDLIADTLMAKLEPDGVVVVIQASHMCMLARGAKALGSQTTTSALRGLFRDGEAARAEFFSIIYGNGRRR